MNQGFWRGLGGGEDTFCLHRGTLMFRVPAAYHNIAVFQMGMNKIPPNFNTMFGAPIWVVRRQRVNKFSAHPDDGQHAGPKHVVVPHIIKILLCL
jgi:hypothetical protein